MRPFTRLSVITLISAAAALPVVSHAAIVAISHSKLDQCGHGNVVCNGVQAFSLTALEKGLIQLPVNRSSNDFVIVNDTGAPVRFLQLEYFGDLSSESRVQCHIEGGAQQILHSCTVVGTASEGDGSDALRGRITAPVEFTYISDSSQSGVPPGGFFDIKTAGFGCGDSDDEDSDHHGDEHNGCAHGYITGTGSGTGSGGPTGPPSA